MSHHRVEGEGLRTTYAFAPQFASSAKNDDVTNVRLSFASSPVHQEGQEFRVTELSFEHVVAYGWNDFEFHLLPSNADDNELGLIEIVDSEIVAAIRVTGRYIGAGIHHYRICFDDHGTYDIVCKKISISYSSSTDASYFP